MMAITESFCTKDIDHCAHRFPSLFLSQKGKVSCESYIEKGEWWQILAQAVIRLTPVGAWIIKPVKIEKLKERIDQAEDRKILLSLRCGHTGCVCWRDGTDTRKAEVQIFQTGFDIRNLEW